MDALRFVPFSSAPKVAFWQAVAERKLRDWRLDDAPRPARGFYWAGGGARVVLDGASLGDGAAAAGATAGVAAFTRWAAGAAAGLVAAGGAAAAGHVCELQLVRATMLKARKEFGGHASSFLTMSM